MHWLSILLFGFSANVDNFTVGVAYGIRKIKIGIVQNLLIAAITAAGTYLSMSVGVAVSKVFSAKESNVIGSIILILIGIWILKDCFLGKKPNASWKDSAKLLDNPERVDKDRSGDISIHESLALAAALSVNNLGLGLGASITGLNVYATVACVFVFSFMMIVFGCMVGNGWLSKLAGKYAVPLSGGIILLIGIYELFI